jgi:quercetin dioxygenase-like cupin family protein
VRLTLCLLVCILIGHAQDMGIVRTMAENKFEPHPALPSCVNIAVQNGDPSKGASVILMKVATGCVIPWHWHTPVEQVMIVSGSAKVEMKDSGKSAVLGPGGFAMMPSKHVHQFTCVSACTVFVNSSAAFDIHFVDSKGTEITADAALKKK